MSEEIDRKEIKRLYQCNIYLLELLEQRDQIIKKLLAQKNDPSIEHLNEKMMNL